MVLIPLLEYYNQRYVNSKNEKQGPSEVSSGEESDNDNTATHYKFQSEQGVSSTLPQIKQAKRIYAQQILTQLSKYHNHIRWDSQGEITKPVLGKNNSVNDLKSLLEIIIYRNKGNLSHFGEVSKILLPIFSKVREFIQNKKLLTYMENTSPQSDITQGTRKTKRRKKNISSLILTMIQNATSPCQRNTLREGGGKLMLYSQSQCYLFFFVFFYYCYCCYCCYCCTENEYKRDS